MEAGDVVGHEPMGIVEQIGSAVTSLKVGDLVVVPFNVCCGTCWMCEQQSGPRRCGTLFARRWPRFYSGPAVRKWCPA